MSICQFAERQTLAYATRLTNRLDQRLDSDSVIGFPVKPCSRAIIALHREQYRSGYVEHLCNRTGRTRHARRVTIFKGLPPVKSGGSCNFQDLKSEIADFNQNLKWPNGFPIIMGNVRLKSEISTNWAEQNGDNLWRFAVGLRKDRRAGNFFL